MSATLEARLKQVVCATLKIPEERYALELAAGEIAEWDSVAHVGLIMAVEQEFDVAFDVTEVIDVETVEDLLILLTQYLPDGRG